MQLQTPRVQYDQHQDLDRGQDQGLDLPHAQGASPVRMHAGSPPDVTGVTAPEATTRAKTTVNADENDTDVLVVKRNTTSNPQMNMTDEPVHRQLNPQDDHLVDGKSSESGTDGVDDLTVPDAIVPALAVRVPIEMETRDYPSYQKTTQKMQNEQVEVIIDPEKIVAVATMTKESAKKTAGVIVMTDITTDDTVTVIANEKRNVRVAIAVHLRQKQTLMRAAAE